MRTLAVLLSTAVLSAGSVQAQATAEYVRDAQGWLRLENGETFRVNPDVITARFAAPVDVASFLASLDGDAAGLTVVRSNRLGIVDLALPVGADPLAAVAALRASGAVDFAEETTSGSYTATIPNDAQFGSLWNLDNTGQSGGTPDADVDGPEAWDIQDGDPDVVVAVLDSGSDWTHPDLGANVWSNPGEVPGNGVDDDGNGFIDDTMGWDFDSNDNNPNGAFNHGTMVASVIGAVGDNGLNLVGLAGGASDGEGCSIMIGNVGSFAPNGAVLDDAILYAADNGARVITMSLSVGTSSAIDAALDYAWNTQGVFVDNASGNNGFGVSYPANHPDCVAVASTNRNDNKSGFSNAGPEVEVSAPGEDITMLNLGGGTTSNSGTSFASPHVAALAGLLFSTQPGLTNDEVRLILQETADDVSTAGYDTGTGWGRINAFNAVSSVADGFVAAVAQAYGTGLAGDGGTVPLIQSLGGAPKQGNSGFGVAVRQAAPGAPATMILGLAEGALPFKGGVLNVDVSQFHLLFDTTINGIGAAAFQLPIPDDDSLPGIELFAQWVIADGAAPVGFALSEGLAITIGTP